MADENKKSNLVYHIWDADNKEYEVPDSDMQELGYDNIAKTFEGGWITMFDDKKQKVDVPIEDAIDYRNQGYMWYDASGSATPINEVGKKPSVPQQVETTQEKHPGLISQALGMLKPTELSEKQQQRVRELPYAKRQESLANKQVDAALASPTAPVETIAGAMGVAGQQVADPINQWSAAYENYYGKEGVDPFQSVVQDIMATGAGDEDPNVPVQMAHQALERFADRTAKAHTQALVANLPEGVSIDEGIENQWYSHDVQDKLQAEAKKMGISYDDYVAHFLKPSLVQSLKQKIPSMKESDAEGVALRLFSHEDDMENRLLDKDIADMLGKYMDEPIDNAIAKADNEAKASLDDAVSRANDNAGPLREDELRKGIFASEKLKDPQRVKENLQGQIEDILTNTDITLDLVKLMDKKGLSYDKLDEVMQKRVYPAVMNVLESKLSDKYIQKYMPKGSLEYIVKSAINNTIAGKVYRKMTQSDYQNWLEDVAYQQYQPGFWERVGSGALTFAGDAWSYWVPGLAGGKITKSIISRAEASLTRDLVSRGVAGQTAARLARIIVNRSKARMLGTGAVNGAVTFGGQQVISTPVDEGYRSGQFDEHGNVYRTNVGKVVRTTAKNATRESLMGAVLQGGTVANMIGKGRGLAANILADVGGKAFDSALMTGSGILEQKMVDPSYQITGKGVAENFLESMANLTAISFPHIVGKYVNFKDSQAFNKAAGFSKDDIATMKKTGYGDLHTALEKLATVKPEYRTEGWMERELANAYADPSIKFGADKNVEDKTAYLTDEYKNFLSDKAVPQTLKIKLQSVIEGKVPNRLPAIIDSRIVPTDDGKVNLETYDVDGNIITRQVFDSKEKADEANSQITLQKDLNAISLSENLYEANVIRDKIQQLYNDAQEKYAMGKPLSDEEKSAVYLYQQANRVTSLRSKLADVQSLTPEEQRASLSDNDRRFIETYEKMLGDFKGNQDSELSDYIRNFESSLGFKRGSTHRALEGHTKEEADRYLSSKGFADDVTENLGSNEGDSETTFIPIGNGRYRTVMEQRIVDAYRNQLLKDVGLRTEMRETAKEISNPNEEVENIPEQISPVNSSPATENTEAETTQTQGEANVSPEVAPQEEQPTPSGDGTASADGISGGQESPVSSGPAPYPLRTNSVPTPSNSEFAANPANLANENQSESKASDAFVMGQNAYKNGDKEGLKSIKYNAETAEIRLKRAFADDEAQMNVVVKAYEEGKDMEQFVAQRANYMTPAQQDAVRKYAEAMEANKGAMDALEHADDGYAESLKQQLSPYTMENGNISSLTLTDGQRGYWKSKNDYGAGFGVFPDANGKPVVKQVSSSQVKEEGKEMPLQEYVNQLAAQKHEATKKNFEAMFDATSLKPNDTVSLSINDKDQPTEAKIVSVNPDGTISFIIAGSKNVTTVPVEQFNKFQHFAQRNGINAELDAEDAHRAENEAIKAEAEKKQRFANGIVGLSDQKPDYSSKETDTKVAADYLQEQYSDNHDQLIKLVNGSRSDIKEQIDNIRKRIVEAEDWLDTNADLEPEQAQSREDKLKLAKEQLDDLTTRYDNWNKIRSLIMTDEEKRDLKDDRTANIKKVGIDKEALTVTDEREVPVLTDEELKKQYPTMDEANDYILSQRKEISKTQEELHRQLQDIDARLNQYLSGETDLTDEEIRDFNTTKADLEARMSNLSASAKELKAQNDKLKTLYVQENKKERTAILAEMTPAEQRKVKAEQYLKDGNIAGLANLYADTSVDFTDSNPNTVDEYVASSIGRHALSFEGREVNGTFLNGLQQELGGTRKDLEKIQVLATEGKGQTFNKYVHDLFENLPDNLRNQGVNTQEIRNSLLELLKGAEKYSDLKNYILKDKISKAEGEMRSMDLAEEEQRAAYEEEKGQQMQEQVGDVSAKYSLSSETAGNGEQFYQDAEGNIDLANVPQEVFEQIGYTAAPFRLTPKMIKHMMDRHNTELKFASPDEAIDFVRDVMNNFDHVRLGYDGALVFSIEDGRRRTGKRAVTILINNDNGKFYGLKTSGYESVKGLEKRPLLWERGANEKTSSTDAATASVTTSKSSLSSEQSGSASHQSNDLHGKDTNNSGNLQENGKNFSERLQNAISETTTEPSEAQKKAGNYKKGHLSFGGYDFTVETPKGVTRSGKDEQGKPWSVTMHDTYGYILGKIGVDGDHIDMFINDAADLDTFDGNVYVVDQVNPETGEFDEHKVMYGYPSEEAATEAYLANYSKGWKGLGKVTAVSKATFDKWLESSDRKTKPFAEYAMVQKEQRAAYEEEMNQDGAHSEAFNKIVDLAKEQKEYWDLMEQGEVDPDDVPEVDVAHDMDELLKTLSDEEFKEVSDVLENLDEEFEYWTANEYERREGVGERKKKTENANTYDESIKEALKPVSPFAIALKSAVESGDKKAIKQAQKELTDALIASDLGLDYLSGQLAQAKLTKKKDELYKVKRATVKPLTDAILAIENAENIENSDFIAQMEYDYENDVHPSEEDKPKMQKFVERLLNFHSDKEDKIDSGYTILSSNIQGDKLYPNEKKWFGTGKYRKGVSWVDKQNNCAYEVNPRFNNRGYLSAVGVHKIVPLMKFDRDVKEVKPSEMTEAQKVAYEAVSTMLKKAGIPVKVVSNEDMEKVAEAQDNLNLAMLLNHPEMRFKIKTPEEKQAAENAYNFAKELRPDKWKQYAVVDMSNPNKMPEYFEKQELARKERSYYNKLMWGNYKVFNLDKSFEDNVAGLTGSFPSEFDPYKIDAQTSKKNELKKQIKETEEAYKLTGQERKEYQNQLMKEYMDEHGLASENDIPDDVWREFDYKAVEKYQDKLDSLFAKYKDLDRQLKAVAEPGVQYLKGKGVVYGYTDGKEIVLNQEHLNPNTPIHEYQHLWRTAAKNMNPELIEHGDKLIMQTQLFAELKEDPNYKHLSDDEICDEAFARLTGEDGAAILEQMAKDAIKENPLDTAKELTIINRLKDWLKKFWYWALDTFTKWKPEDIKKMTLEDIRNLVLRDLAQGVDPRTVLNEKKAKNAEDADKTLVGVHNISEDKLLKAIKQGGLANPSVAVIDSSKQDHKAYGGISLILPSDKVAKRTGKNAGTWQGDAYTPTYPQVERHISNKGSEQVNKDVLSVPKEIQHEVRNGIYRWLDGNTNSGLKYLFLHEMGNAPKMVELQHKYSDKVYNDLKSITSGDFDISSIGKADAQKVLDMYIDNVFDGDRTAYDEKQKYRIARYKKQVAEGEKNPFLLTRAKNALEQYDKYGFYFDKVQNFVRNVERDHLMTGVNMDGTLNEVEDYIKTNNLTDEFNTWLEGKEKEYGIKEVIFDGFTPSGNRRYVPNTLENVSKIMKKQGRNGATGAAVSFQNFAARLMPSYGTLKDIRSKKGLLTSDREKFDKFREKWSNVFFELGMKCQPDATGTFDDYGLARLSEAAMTRDPQAYLKKEYNVDFSDEDTKRLKEMVKAIKEEHPAMYFETKFERPVGFDEFSAAVVPTTTKKEVKEALKNAGVSIFEYDEKSDADRKRAFNEAINSNHEIRFHRVTEPEELDRLNKEKTFRMYSGMQELDGKLYSPMAAIIDGKRTDATEIGAWMGADERPDLVKGGKFQLVKTDKNPGAGEGPVRAAYNPYMHTSTSMMNDQFTGAYARGNIKVVEWEIPESEKTSGYRAEGAKDAVGLVPWHSGSVNGLLPKDRQRSVMLSRWRKAVRVVPDSEVAESIAEQLEGTGLAIPWNVVTPNQLRELAKLGVPITTEESGQQAPETKEKFMAQMDELKKEFPQAQFVDVKMTKDAFKEWGGKGIVKSPILEQKLQKHPDSLMKAGTYFSGGGLVEEGLKGIIDPVVAVEYDRKISGVYRNNFGQHIVTADVRDVDPKELVKHIDGEVEYFHASPVCKNYSQAKSNGGEVELDKETAKSTADFIDAVKPRVVTIENVKGYKDSEAMKIITQALDKNGYKWDADVYNAADFGGYTSRERLIVRAVKDGELPEKPKKQPRKGGWLEAVEDILPTLTEKKSGVAPWMDARLKVDGIDWQKVEKPLYVMGSAYADGKIPHAYGDEILPTLRTKSGDVIIMPGGKVLRADGRVLARITGLGDDYLLPKTESLAHTIIGNGIPVQLTKGVIAPLLNKDDLSGRNVLARLGSSIFKNNWDADMQKQVSDRVVNTANKLGGAEATVYTSVDEVPDAYLSDVKNGATGWYDPTTHTVHVYLPNCADVNEAERTVLHEKIGHEGMEVLLGGENEVRKFANFVYRSASKDVRGKIIDFANKYDPDWKNNDRMNVGTQEYIAHLAEEGPKTAEDFSLWTKIKHYLIKVLKTLGVRVPGLLNDKDLRYYLMKAGKALHVWDEMPREKQEALMKQASNAEIKDALSDGAGKGKPRQKKGESYIQYMKRAQEWRKWQNAREDKENPEPPMFYDIDKDEAGKKEWAQLNKDWRERHHLVGEEPTGMPIRMEGEEDDAYKNRKHEYEKWQAAMKDQEDPLPDMFAFEKEKQEEVKRKYEDWLAKHDLLEQQQADLDLYEGKIYPAETNPEADALEQQVMQDLAEVTSTDVSKEGAARSVHDAVIYRRKNIESASADDAIFINSVKQELNKMANASYLGRKADAIADAVKETVTGKSPKTQAKKMAEAIPYIIEAPRRMRDIADEMNAIGAFENGHIHVTAKDIDAIQPFTDELRVLASKSHKIEKDGKETIVYDDVPSMTEVASKMAKAINDNHVGEEGFVPVDGTDILAEHVLPVVLKRIVPEGVEYKNLSEEMQSLLDKIREWYDKTFTWLKDSHTVREDIGYTADYVNHRWDKEKSDDKAYADLVEGRQRTKSPNEKPRKVSTYMEGVDAGLVPKTTDITDLLAYYSQSNIEAFANKAFLQELSGINVIERNKDGEITSSMPLLSSIQPKEMMVDENKYTPYVVPGINTVWVYNQGKIFNKSAEDWFNAAFGTVKLSKILKGIKNAMSIAKTLELGFSGFHAGALTEVYAVQNSAEFGPAKAMAYFMKYLIADTAKNHQLPTFANPEVFKEAAKHLVKFGSASDYATADIENLYDKVHSYVARLHSKLVEGNVAMKAGSSVTFPLEVATELLKMSQKGLDVALWSYLHDGLKLATYQLRAERTRERAKKLNWDEDMLNKALDEDGQFVNDMFGGQHFDVLGISKKMQTILDFIFLSKDWLISTTRHALSIFGYGSIWNEASIKNFMEYYKHVLGRGEMTKEDYLRLSRSKSGLLCYGIGFMIGYEGLSQLVNAAMRAWDEEKQKEKADEIRKTNPSYKSPYELAYPNGMHWYDYLMRGNSLGQQSKIFMGRYADGTEMYIRHGKQFREIPELFFDAKDNFAIPGPMVRRMYGKASPLLRGMIDTYKWYLSPDYGDKEMQRKYGENLGLIPKLGSYYVPFAVPTQKDKEFKMLDLVFPSSKGFSRYKAQDYFKTFIMSEDKQGLAMTYNACVQNGIDPEVQLKAAISSVKALEASEMSDGVTSLQEASKRFDAAKSITEKKKMRQKMKKFLSQSDYKAFTQKEALDMVQGYLNGDEDLKEMEKAESKYLMKAKAEDVTEDWRIQNVWNGTMETYQEYQRLKDVDKAKANAFKNSKTNKRLFAARKAISAAKKKMNKAKKQMDGQNDAAKLVEIRKTRKELLDKLNGME